MNIGKDIIESSRPTKPATDGKPPAIRNLTAQVVGAGMTGIVLMGTRPPKKP